MKLQALAAILLLSPLALPLLPSAEALIGSTWTEEIPGLAFGVTELHIEGDANKQGVAYQSAVDQKVGFAIRNAGVWALPTSDITGAGTTMDKIDGCYLGGSTWAVIGRSGTNALLYKSTNDGVNWTLMKTFTGVGVLLSLSCATASNWGVMKADTQAAGSREIYFNRTTDAGSTWTGGYSLNDDTGDPSLHGTRIAGTLYGADMTAYTATDYAAVFLHDAGGGFFSLYYTTSDDGGVFWSVPSISASLGNGAPGPIGIDGINGNNIAIAKDGGNAYYPVVNGVSEGNSGSMDRCGVARCEISINNRGQALAYTGGGDQLLFRDAVDSAFTSSLAIPGTETSIRSVHLLNDYAYVVYADASQGGRLEFQWTEITPPPFTYTNPNGNNWGEIKANYDPDNLQVYLKERIASDDEDLGHVYRLNDELGFVSHFNACPSTTISSIGGTTKSESLSTPGNLAIYPDPSQSTILSTACLNDYTVTDEHYVINTFTAAGAFTGGMPYADVDFVDTPAHIDFCLNGGVGIQSFAQVDPVNFTVANVFGAQTEYLTFDVSRGHEKSFIIPDLAIMAVDPLSQETCSLYFVSTTSGFGKISHERGGDTESEWTSTQSGDAIAAYGGRVWVANTAGTAIIEYQDLGASPATTGSHAVTTAINPFNERLSVSHDGAYLIAHCGTNEVCVIDTTSYEVVVSQTIPAGGVVHYDLDHYNRYLYVARDDVAYAYDVSALTSAFGDPDNCVGPTPLAACTPTTTTTTTTGIGPGGVGGEQGGFIDEPGSGIPGLDIEGTAASIGMSAAALAWLLGILWVSIFTVAFGTLPMLGSGGKFSVALAAVGYIVGLGGATAFSLLPVWFILVNGVLGAGFLVVKLRGA